jgi:P27 family predicted phage terminase small subunit
MARGAKPRDPAVAAAAGNPGKRRLRKAREDIGQPVPVDEWAPPSDLAPAVAEVWRRELPRLRQMGLLKVTDLAGFRVFCGAFARYEAGCRVLEAEGCTVQSVSKHGTLLRKHPMVDIVQAAERTIRAYMAEFGMTSQSRVRVASQLASRQLPLPLSGGGEPASPQPAAAPAPSPTDHGPIGFLSRSTH